MENSNGIKQKLKKLLSSAKHIFPKAGYGKSGIRPAKDWQTILSVFALGLIFCGALAFYFDWNVSNGNFWNATSGNQSTTVYTINQKNLNTVMDYFNQKEKNLKDLENNPKIVADPSL